MSKTEWPGWQIMVGIRRIGYIGHNSDKKKADLFIFCY